MKSRGFTLVELVMVVIITGTLAAAVTLFLRPVIDSYLDTGRRADLADIGDTALRRMAQDVRSAVPNSVRLVSPTCFQFVPTRSGGRYRMAADIANDAGAPCAASGNCSAPLDINQATSVFDVLSPLSPPATINDWVVIGNQNTDDVYTGNSRGQISAIATPRTTDGTTRITLSPATQFPVGYTGGRFVIVPGATPTIYYSCVGSVLYRRVAAFDSVPATQCAATSGDVVASDLAACTFVYDANHGATQQSGFVWMRLQLQRNGESVTLSHGAHVDNVP